MISIFVRSELLLHRENINNLIITNVNLVSAGTERMKTCIMTADP